MFPFKSDYALATARIGPHAENPSRIRHIRLITTRQPLPGLPSLGSQASSRRSPITITKVADLGGDMIAWDAPPSSAAALDARMEAESVLRTDDWKDEYDEGKGVVADEESDGRPERSGTASPHRMMVAIR